MEANQSEDSVILAAHLPDTTPQSNAMTASTAQPISSASHVPLRFAEAPNPYCIPNAKDERAIEDTDFPFEFLSDIAELESWRKEINRPVYHLHKWWAQRLGSVFRAILIGTFAPQGSDILKLFYQRVRLPEAMIYDPFMGSGTTIGEALKLGARAIGRDINPVAYFVVRNALSVHSRRQVVETYRALERDVAPILRRLYQAQMPDGSMAETLYYFWVKVIPCPECNHLIDLFSSYVFSKHAYPTRHPEAHALCPYCDMVNFIHHDDEHATCRRCQRIFAPNMGPAKGAKATCPNCQYTFQIAKAVQRRGTPPSQRLYAKLVLRPNGSKEYLPIDDFDKTLYKEAASLLRRRNDPYPIVAIDPGYNTNQVLNYCYTRWHQMFNDRQLLCLSLLSEHIQQIPDARLRELFTCLFSGTLEFNNMFASFKGEGTGAVRHMFSHHILKPERTPLEANLWGTPKSSGAFSTLFESRLIRLLDYCENPFELGLVHRNGTVTSKKVYGLSCQLGHETANNLAEFQRNGFLYLSCGDSAKTDLAAESVDAVVTDPPFFDNVHYSQLADFFYAWQSHILGGNGYHATLSTRSKAEVQQSDPTLFTERLAGVLVECYRVLRPHGVLVFTYHHSRPEGWSSILEAVVRAGFHIVATHPIKAEMSVAMPKQQAKEPIDLDVILVCRKRGSALSSPFSDSSLLDHAAQEAKAQVLRLNNTGRYLSRNDMRVVLSAQVIKRLSWQSCIDMSIDFLKSRTMAVESAIDELHRDQQPTICSAHADEIQLSLW